MTCVSPRDLVQQYKEFVHGDPRSTDRRVVLNNTFATEVQDVLVFAPNDLLERFLFYVTTSCKATKDTQHPILVLIFGHGQEKSFAITIGGAGKFKSCPLLYQAELEEAVYRHNPNPNVAVLTTSCFGGGWTQTGFLSITAMSRTAMSGTDAEHELISWPKNASIGRFCGSRYASGVAEALIRMEIQNLDMESENEMHLSATFEALVEMIHSVLTKEVDVREKNSISFSAKDDLWDMEWRARTGFPLTTYQEKWQALRLVQQGAFTGQSLSASVRFSDFIHLSIPEAEFRLKRLAYDYLTSQPGDDSAAKNHFVHGRCHEILKGATLPPRELEMLAGALKYRLKKVVARATEYKDRLGIEFPDCHQVDYASLMVKMENDHETRSRHDTIRGLVFRAQLFDGPGEDGGMPYVKGFAYLALALLHTGWSFRFWEDPELRGMVGTLAQSFKKRLRSQSPTKRKRQSLEGVFPGPGWYRERRSGESGRS